MAARAALASALAAALLGCAAPGQPSVRQSVVPRPVTDLAARQRGDAVVLSFTLPRDSTAQKPLTESPAVEVYRGTPAHGPGSVAATGPAQSRKSPMQLSSTIPAGLVDTYMKNGRFEFSDPLDPAGLAREPGAQIIYMVRTRASRRHDSLDSNSVTLQVYPPPEAILDLRATVTKDAIVLAWTPLENAATYNVYRAEVEPSGAAAAIANPSMAGLLAPVALLGPASGAEYRDTRFEFGHVYFYLVRAVAQFASTPVESADSNIVVISARNVFPPPAPQEVEASVAPATAQTPVSVELTWAIGTEPDLAGYAVYRSEQADMPGKRLTDGLLSTPTFRDVSVLPGRRYFYCIQAVDRAGNESPFSDVAVIEVPE